MQFIRNHRIIVLLVVGISSLFWIFSCDDKPFEPVEPKDYPFYLTEDGSNQLFVFHPISKKLDSMKTPWNVDAPVTVSADGKLLYVALGTSVLVVETDSLTTVNELFYQNFGPVAVSPDNKLLATLGGDLYILRTSDYSVVFSDTNELIYSGGNFSSDSKTFYCASRRDLDSIHVVYKVDLSDSTFPITRKGFPYGAVTEIIPSIDESKWFLYLHIGLWTYSFEVYDVIQDSIIFRDVLVPGAGYHAASPDGKYVFYTGPGRCGDGPPPDPSFKIHDVEKNAIEAVFTDSAYFCAGQVCVAPRDLAISPDSRWLGILGGDACLRPEFYVYDIKKSKIVFRVGLDTGLRLFRNISTQKKR